MSTLQARFDELLSYEPPHGEYTREDAWSNDLTGIGTPRDKVSSTTFTPGGCLSWQLLENMFHNDDVAARFCELLPKECFRKGFSTGDKKLDKRLKKLGLASIFRRGWTFGRLYGGSATYVGMGDVGNESKPAKPGEVQYLKHVDRMTISVTQVYPDGPKQGAPMLYTVTPLSTVGANPVVIHESRIITWPGALTSDRKRISNGHWDDSALQRVYWVLQAYGLTWGTVVHILQDVAQGVFSIKGLFALLTSGQADTVISRLKMMEEMRSSGRAIAVDKDTEAFERKQTPLSSVPELIDRMTERLSSAFEQTPLTILMGSSPSGMNATGQSDLEIWYSKVEGAQEDVLCERIERVLELDGKPDAELYFPSLWSPSDKEISESRYTNARADQLRFSIGAISGDEARMSAAFDTPAAQIDTTKPAGDPQAIQLAQMADSAPSAPADGNKKAVRSAQKRPKSHFSPTYNR